ncbi:DUF2087 domain-containing protein [Clostridium akagii]|uniref:DUF2087 domain-containing protein n=1 Tax=Clostridium akagii TaxID=91623 RepID=UPI000479E021|nr:DUF2087 domain-containing protein [Clostridium akagii]
MKDVEKFLDKDGKIRSWPTKTNFKVEVLKYMASKFELGKDYKEKEVNDIIEEWHTFGDHFLLRRGMIENKLLFRTRNGSKYWREQDKAKGE